MKLLGSALFPKLSRFFVTPGLEPALRAERILRSERNIVFPIKGLLVLITLYYFYFSHWLDEPGNSFVLSSHEAALVIRGIFFGYMAVNFGVAFLFYKQRALPMKLLQWIMYGTALLDALILAGLIFITDGFESAIFWFFPTLIVRNASSIPLATPQIVLNLAATLFYFAAGLLNHAAIANETVNLTYIGTLTLLYLGLNSVTEIPAEPILLRLLILLLWTFFCYGYQLLSERHKRDMEEAVEFASRQEQLRTAGRLSAEIAHRLKNPLSIINNAAFTIGRKIQDQCGDQVQIIREEVDRADRILTELMGYAKLAEGRVEKLQVTEELESAITQVFPPAANYEVEVRCEFEPDLPVLLMQRAHLSEIFVNILQNAREALHGKGIVTVSAGYGADYSVVVTIADNGPGIARDKVEMVFESYFSTKEKGTGLGLAIAKHNAEMYGGQIRIESELGNGARFILQFPSKVLIKVNP